MAAENKADKKILLVGHCGPDSWMLKSFVQTTLPGASVKMVNDAGALKTEAPAAALLLVNRVLDGDFTSNSGIELIRELAAAKSTPAMMLVSNYPEAQQEAADAGARPGFGKAQLGDAVVAQRLRHAAGMNGGTP